MSQTSITSYFHSRKRPAPDDTLTSKSKIRLLENADGKREISQVTPTLISKSVISQSEVKPEISSRIKDNPEILQNTEVKTEQPSRFQETLGAFEKKPSNVSKLTKSESITSSRKELSLGDIRKKLAGSSRLAELKASAERISKGIQQLTESSEKRNLKEFKSIDVEVPLSPSKKLLIQKELLSPKKETAAASESQKPLISPRKVFVSPIKSPTKIPAYLRQSSLAVCPTSLPLPYHYRFLAELFRSMETVVSLLYNRNEKITFSKLKPSVQEMLKRNFTEKHLAQIKKMVPDFYNFELERVKNFSNTNQRQQYELILSPNFPSEIKTMNPTVLLERRRYFYETLINLVKKHHAKYLLTLDPPMVIPDDKLTRWHPEFHLEKIPDIECAKLPEVPNQEKFSTAQDVLAKAKELLKCNTKMERALEKLAQAQQRGLTEQEKLVIGVNVKTTNNMNSTSTQTPQTSLPSTSGMTLLNPALRNLPPALLEKVKAKQAAKALEAMTRSSEYEQKYLVYSRLPDLARTLRNIFVTERKNVLALNIILSKLDISFKANVSANDLQRDIRALTQEVPEWVKLHVVRNNTYLKLNRSTDLKNIINKLQTLAEKFKNV